MPVDIPGPASSVSVQHEPFDVGAEIAAIAAGRPAIGAVASFVGLVRGNGDDVRAMTLEHYPGMTERQLQALERLSSKEIRCLESSQPSLLVCPMIFSRARSALLCLVRKLWAFAASTS